MERIDKLLASTGRWSRREAKALVQEGRVLVDGVPAAAPEQKLDPALSRVLVDGEDATVKRFYSSDTTVTLMPQSTNPEHKPQMYDLSKTPIRVLGKAVEVKFLV